MLGSKIAKTVVLGFATFVLGLLWEAAYYYYERLQYPPGWILDGPLYMPAKVLTVLGALVFLGSLAFLIARSAYRRFSN